MTDIRITKSDLDADGYHARFLECALEVAGPVMRERDALRLVLQLVASDGFDVGADQRLIHLVGLALHGSRPEAVDEILNQLSDQTPVKEQEPPEMPGETYYMPEPSESDQTLIKKMRELEGRASKLRAAEFERWAEAKVNGIVFRALADVLGSDKTDKIRDSFSKHEDEAVRLRRVLDCARHLLEVFDVRPCPGGFSRKTYPGSVPVDWFGELWCAVAACDVVPPASGDEPSRG